MSDKYRVIQFCFSVGVVILAISIALSFLPESAIAHDTDIKPVISFLDAQESLVYGPPFPSNIIIRLSLSSTLTNTGVITPKRVIVSLKAMNFTSSDGQPISTTEVISGYQTAGYTQKIDLSSATQIVSFTLSLSPTSNLSWDIYKGLLEANVDNGLPVTQNISLVISPQGPPVIISPKIVVKADRCPQLLRRILELLESWFSNRCYWEQENLEWEQDNLEEMEASVRLKGFNDYYQTTSTGTAVSEERAERVLLKLGAAASACSLSPPPCEEYKINIEGPLKSGKYVGTFYLDGADTETATTKTEVVFFVKDFWLFPLLVIILGIAVSYSLSWYYGFLSVGQEPQNDGATKLSTSTSQNSNPANANQQPQRGEAPQQKNCLVKKFQEEPLRTLLSWFMWLIGFLLFILFGFHFVYLSNNIFGSAQDYLGAFLWGATASATITVISQFLDTQWLRTVFPGLSGK